MSVPCINVWRFHEAPLKYQRLSDHGGDEDWLAFIPTPMEVDALGLFEEGGSFGCCSVSHHKAEGGVVVIGAHA